MQVAGILGRRDPKALDCRYLYVSRQALLLPAIGEDLEPEMSWILARSSLLTPRIALRRAAIDVDDPAVEELLDAAGFPRSSFDTHLREASSGQVPRRASGGGAGGDDPEPCGRGAGKDPRLSGAGGDAGRRALCDRGCGMEWDAAAIDQCLVGDLLARSAARCGATTWDCAAAASISPRTRWSPASPMSAARIASPRSAISFRSSSSSAPRPIPA